MPKLFSLLIIAVGLTLGAHFALADYTGPLDTPPACDPGDPGCDPPIDVSITSQIKTGRLGLGGLSSLDGIFSLASNYSLLNNLLVGINGKVGATHYCDKDGNNCVLATDLDDDINTTGITACTGTLTDKIIWDGSKFVCAVDRVGFKSVWHDAGGFSPANKLDATASGILVLRSGQNISFSNSNFDPDGDGVTEPGLIINATTGGAAANGFGTIEVRAYAP